MTPPRPRALALLAALASSCGDAPGGPLVELEPRDGGERGARDAGSLEQPDAGRGRPDGGAVLPAADAELRLPFRGPTLTHPFEVDANLGLMDVVLAVDTTQSMQSAIDGLQTDLRRVLIGGLRARVPMVSFGVASYQDFPRAPFGSSGGSGLGIDSPFRLQTAITSDELAVASAVARLDRPLGFGGDVPESSAEALFQVATGVGYEHLGQVLIPPYDHRPLEGGGELGGVGFRPSALHVVVHVTDAPSHRPADYAEDFPGTHDLEQAAQAFIDLGANMVGIVTRDCAPIECADPTGNYSKARRDLEQMAVATGGVRDGAGGCPTGLGASEMPLRDDVCPLVFDVDGTGEGLSEQLVDGIVALIDELRFDSVTASLVADPLGFVQAIEALPSTKSNAPTVADQLPASMPDGIAETFLGVRSGSTLRFSVRLRNDRIAPTDVEQRFRLTLQVVGDGLLLGEQMLRVVVPALSDTPPAPLDAGMDAADPGSGDAGH